MARKPFSELSASYQGRLIAKGITPEDYDAGVSLKAARGHSRTPERPSQAYNNPDQYENYFVRSILKGKEIPLDIHAGISLSDEPLPERRLGDNIGYPGRTLITTAIFTLAKGYGSTDQIGSVTFISYGESGPDEIISDRTVTYHMSEFKELARLAKQRGYVVQVTSVPSKY